jgi:eukaryotic-like serine/threonine-protein kinase
VTGPLHAPPYADDLPPTAVVGGRYRIDRRVGVGGMATVDVALDLELERPVALKRLHPHLVSDQAIDRFRREARAAARLRHPGVVTVHDWGFDGDTPYLVMELVEGPSLRTALERRGRLGPRELLSVLAPAIAGLAAAHRAGLVHRDVTPGNVLLGPDGASKMADFGLARPVASASVTVPDAVVGSPHYLSPEAALGERLDARSDVYSLGCVVYECLTGQPPFDGATAAVIATKRLSERVPPPSEHVRSGLSSALDELVRTATEPEPEDRFADADDLLAELRAAVPEGPVPVDLRDGSDLTVVIPEHATRVLDDLDEDDEDHRRGRGWLRRLLSWLLVLALVGGGGWLTFDRVIAPVTAVPEVVGLAGSEARAALEEAGFRVRIAEERAFDRDVPPGSVVEQSITAPTRQLTEVQLVLSAGPRTGTLPPLTGRDVTAARAALEELGLDLTVTTTVGYDDALAPGTVLDASPAGGATVSEGTEVTLTISDGPAPVELPDLTGRLEGAASAELVGLGLVARVVERRHDPAPAGTVIATTPAQGDTLRRGGEVELVVSDGPEPVEVPDVEGQRESAAVRALEEAGFTVDVRYVTTLLPLARGIVDEQDPDPGTTRPRGDTVRIFVWQ